MITMSSEDLKILSREIKTWSKLAEREAHRPIKKLETEYIAI